MRALFKANSIATLRDSNSWLGIKGFGFCFMEYLHGSGCGILLHHESISLEVIDDNVGENNEQKLMNKTDKPNFVAILVRPKNS